MVSSQNNLDWRSKLDPKAVELLEGRLVDKEAILEVSEIHNGIFWPAAAVFTLMVFASTLIAPQLGYVFGLATLVTAMAAYLRSKILLLVLTNKRIFARSGLLQIDFIDMRFDKIESLETERMLLGYILGYANLVVMGTGNRYISIPYVANAEQIRKTFNEIILNNNNE